VKTLVRGRNAGINDARKYPPCTSAETFGEFNFVPACCPNKTVKIYTFCVKMLFVLIQGGRRNKDPNIAAARKWSTARPIINWIFEDRNFLEIF